MIELRFPMKIESNLPSGWLLILWEGEEVFDYTTPFRAMLGDIVEAIGQDREHDLQLPPHENGEDFVEGTLRFGNASLRTYYEHSLNYLALISDNEGMLRDVADRIQTSIRRA